MEDYIVRIYRRGEKKRSIVIGMVEDVSAGSTKSFSNSDELLRILGASKKRLPLKGKKGASRSSKERQ